MAARKTLPRSVLKRFLVVITVFAVPLGIHLLALPVLAFKQDIREHESK